MLVQRSPGAEIVPAKIRWQTENLPGLFPLGRTRFQHRIIDADIFAFRIKFAECRIELGRAMSRGDLLEQGRGAGKMLTQRAHQSTRTPKEHTAIPIKSSSSYEFRRHLRIGFLRKTPNPQRMAAGGMAHLDITVAGFRPIGTNPENNNVLACSRNFYAAL